MRNSSCNINIEIIFLDNNKELVEKLQQKKEYKINYENEKIETFNNFLIFSSICSNWSSPF